MVISADFEKQKQYFDQENIASSILLYLFIALACQNRPSDEGLTECLSTTEFIITKEHRILSVAHYFVFRNQNN
jgi:hypothetical protein